MDRQETKPFLCPAVQILLSSSVIYDRSVSADFRQKTLPRKSCRNTRFALACLLNGGDICHRVSLRISRSGTRAFQHLVHHVRSVHSDRCGRALQPLSH